MVVIVIIRRARRDGTAPDRHARTYRRLQHTHTRTHTTTAHLTRLPADGFRRERTDEHRTRGVILCHLIGLSFLVFGFRTDGHRLMAAFIYKIINIVTSSSLSPALLRALRTLFPTPQPSRLLPFTVLLRFMVD